MKAFATSGDADYRRETIISPYTRVEGRHLQSCFHDPMHVLFLGTCRGLFSSSLAYWIRHNYLHAGIRSLDEKLKRVSADLKAKCREQKFLASTQNLNTVLYLVFSS